MRRARATRSSRSSDPSRARAGMYSATGRIDAAGEQDQHGVRDRMRLMGFRPMGSGGGVHAYRDFAAARAVPFAEEYALPAAEQRLAALDDEGEAGPEP
jgi:hypothetical protein